MKRILLILLAGLMLCSTVSAETSSGADLDLTGLSGSLLIARLNEIRSDPWPLEGQTLRVIGQYYEDETRRALIVHNCGLNSCEEVGLTLIIPEDTVFSQPELNAQVLVEGTVQPFDTEWGTPSARLLLLSLTPLTASMHGT